MIRKLKALSAVLGSILAVAVFSASAAEAVEFTASQYPANLEGVSVAHVQFKIGTKVVTCKQEHFKASTSSGSMFETYKSSYTECTVGGLPATVTMNGCDWEYYPNTKVWKLVCPAGKKVVIHWYSSQATHKESKDMCKVEIGEQEHTNVEYENSGSPEDVKLKLDVTGISYAITEGTVLLCGALSGSEGSLSGETTIKATNEAGEPINFMIG